MSSSDTSGSGKCPVDHETRSLWGLWGTKDEQKKNETSSSGIESSSSLREGQPASLEEAARHAQTPQPFQRLPLSTHRAESTIPRGTGNPAPSHQLTSDNDKNNSNHWIYPSEQQVFNAMKRKGWKGIEEESIPSFLQIHNSVNERSWNKVLEWESSYFSSSQQEQKTVRLSRFEGRPKDLTPKAWLLSTLGLSPEKPFDRHDWYVVSTGADGSSSKENDDSERRYVLDFYMRPTTSSMPSVEIDVRPALDTPRAFGMRASKLLADFFPGIAREFDQRSSSTTATRESHQ